MLVLSLYPALARQAPQTHQESARMLGLALTLGILLNNALVALFGQLGLSLLVGCVFSLAGTGLSVFLMRAEVSKILQLGWARWGIAAYITLLFSLVILFTPLSAWDARSIWFFHAKMIFHNLALTEAAGWNQPFAAFSHVAYPKLVPILAAQCGYLAGYWNEYLPKISLLVLFVPSVFALLAFSDRLKISTAYLFLLFYFSLGWWLWNGYMDGYLALFAGIACLYLARWLADEHPLDALTGIAFTALAICLKNEGLLFALTASLSLVTLYYLKHRTLKLTHPVSIRWNFWLVVAVCFLGYLVWSWKKSSWGMTFDVPSAITDTTLMRQRIDQGGLGSIGEALFIRASVAKSIGILAIAIVALVVVRVRFSISMWLPMLTSALYFIGIFVIYLTTKNDLTWHLATSADRTMLPVLHGIFASVFLILQRLEEAPPNKKRDSKTSV